MDKEIDLLKNDNDFQILIQKYEAPNFYSVMGNTRREGWHSNFVNWILDPKGNHGLGFFPLIEFLKLVNSKIENINEKIQIENIDIENMHFQKEVVIKEGRPDIIGESSSFILVIENKVEASETKTNRKYQTDRYYAHYEGHEYVNKQKCYIYLSPRRCNKLYKPNNEHFIPITYQELFDNVIYVCINNENICRETQNILNQYAIAISNPNSGKIHMAYTEKGLAERIYQRHESAFKLIRSTMNDINRDKESPICVFYEEYKQYINEVLGAIGQVQIIPESGKPSKGKKLVKDLCEKGVVIPEKTELIATQKGATYIIQVYIVDGEYKCCVGYSQGNYNKNKWVPTLKDENNEDCVYDTINQAARDVQIAHYSALAKIDNKKYIPGEGDGVTAGLWKVIHSGKAYAEGKTIREIQTCKEWSEVNK